MLAQQLDEDMTVAPLDYYSDPFIIEAEALLAVDEETGQEDLVFSFTNQPVRGFVWQAPFSGELYVVDWAQCYIDETMEDSNGGSYYAH